MFALNICLWLQSALLISCNDSIRHLHLQLQRNWKFTVQTESHQFSHLANTEVIEDSLKCRTKPVVLKKLKCIFVCVYKAALHWRNYITNSPNYKIYYPHKSPHNKWLFLNTYDISTCWITFKYFRLCEVLQSFIITRAAVHIMEVIQNHQMHKFSYLFIHIIINKIFLL